MSECSANAELRERRRVARELACARPNTRTRILLATEQLLAETSLHDLGVAQIMCAADVSRATFYSYFSSKFEIAGALLDATMDEMVSVLAAAISTVDGPPTSDFLRTVIAGSIRVWQDHRAIIRATHESWPTAPELRERWLGIVTTLTDAIAGELDRQRAGGVLSSGLDYRQRVASALWSTEQLWYVAGSELSADIVGEESLLATLVDLWMGLLYPGMPEMRMPGAANV